MKFRPIQNIFGILATAWLMSMCGTMTTNVKGVQGGLYPSYTFPTDTLYGYQGERASVYFYVEGLKAANINGDNKRAAMFFDLSMKSDSTFAAAYYAAAMNMAPDDPALALQYSAKANALDSTNIWYRTQLGKLMIINSKYADALPVFNSLIKESTADPDTYRTLAALHEVSGKPFAALAVIDSAQTRFGKLEELAAYKRELLIKVNLTDLAITESQHLVDEYPHKYENYLILANLHLNKHSDSLALANINKALELDPTGIDPLLSLSEYYKAIGDNKNFLATTKVIFMNKDMELDVKIRFFKDLIRDTPFYAANYFSLTDIVNTLRITYPQSYEVTELYADNLISAGNVEEGINIYKAYLTDTTSIMAPYQMIIDGETYLKRVDSVRKYTELALARFPGNVGLHIRRAGSLQYLMRENEAHDAYREALKFTGTDSLRSVVFGLIGDMYHQQNKMRFAYRFYDNALKHNKDNVLVLNNYAYYLSEEKRRLDKALIMAERVMELQPGNPTYIDTYAWVLYRLGRYEEAKKAMLSAISLDRSGNPEYMLHYGDILFEMGDHFMAKYYWEKALKAGYDEKKIEERIKKTD